MVAAHAEPHCAERDALGELERAEDCISQAFGYFFASGNPWRTMECLRLQGDLCVRGSSPEFALRCFRKALAIAEELGARVEAGALRARLEVLAGLEALEDDAASES